VPEHPLKIFGGQDSVGVEEYVIDPVGQEIEYPKSSLFCFITPITDEYAPLARQEPYTFE
jgi:hypothetical protein